ncbi:S9 family peptidase [Thalassomonas viridans]|uniref:S9 family peptidase n=1 Tax=Thalassomonas viridans TaxID=137584 RepID=A0AAF0C962_9GAMM|nr:prolyl oligopeptidase family serine peptidase [Thalassomonas viridans]WDE07167.1 S9 family peptidase [Thalassomonas viridans]
MKLQLLAAAISFSLVACAANQTPSSPAGQPAKAAEVVKATPAAGTDSSDIITLKQIMADPDWIGRAPESWYWGDDNQTVYFKQKREGSPIRDLYRKSTGAKGNGEQVALADMHAAADMYAVTNNDGTLEAYEFEGNVFVKDLAGKKIRQLTFTSAYEYSVMFLADGNVAYRAGNAFYRHDLDTNQVTELANLLIADEPEGIKEPDTYIGKEQHKLIDYVALQHRNAKLAKQQKDALEKGNKGITKTDFYLGEGNKIVHASLSPAGDKIFVSIADDVPDRYPSDIMPNYIAGDAEIKAQQVRSRVSDNRKYSETLFVLDLNTMEKSELSYETLPGFDQDVLAEVRKENFKREGKEYTSEKTPRDIHVIRANFPIQWHKNGQQLAVMLEAWDNKDRWIATVDFNENSLVSQHRLHDDAWINWSFNEFGWLSNSDKLYYLSEESGYSHVYVKSPGEKATQITSGKYEVRDLTLSRDEQTLYFKGNKKHPGIYEIYSLDIAKGEVTALTDLGGKNDYQLSNDESKLLIEHSEITMPPELYVQDATPGATAVRLTHTVSEKFLSLPWTAPSVVAVPSSHQEDPVYTKVYLPKNFDKSAEKHRAVMFTHGAGYLQNAHLGWSVYFREFMFNSMLAQQGYVVLDPDYRASEGYGRDWRTSIYRHMGKPEVQDMRDAVEWAVKNANVDKDRVGTYGGSYGGFLTLMSLFTDPDLFQTGAAIRLVSDWAHYNHGYTSNILNTPEDDAIAYERSSPIYFAEGLTKPLLINAPMVDDNVFFQDTVRLVQRLIELEKQDFETAIYPVEPHGFVQPSSWLDEYRRIYKLFETRL